MEFFPSVVISHGEAELIAQAMLTVARADGDIHDHELAMLASFYVEFIGGDAEEIKRFATEPNLETQIAALGIKTDMVAKLLLKTCILCAYADGEYHEEEKKVIDSFAEALRIDKDTVDALEAGVKEFVVSEMTRLHSRSATLGMTPGDTDYKA